ncbi:MAG: histidine phosphatase family protein [Elusimicrobiales bacterium]|nr:histidine phosphatase family protein [Elusimicrobiales bacterium]
MTELVFMRHGHALSRQEAGAASDSERPLSPRGEREALESARRLQAAGFAPDRIVSSPFLRACRTAEIAAGVFPSASRETDRAISDGPAQALLDLAQGFYAGKDRVLLIGHQPLLGAVAAYLLGDDPFDLSPAGFVRLKCEGEPGCATLLEFYAPPPSKDGR